MPKTHCFSVEYAKSSMSTCRVCMAKIVKDSLRVGHTQMVAENDITAGGKEVDAQTLALAAAMRWHHFECFPRMKGSKWMSANLPQSADQLDGFKALKKADQKKLRDLWKGILGESGKSAKDSGKRKAEAGTESTAKAAKMKRPAAATAPLSKLTSVQGVLTPAQFKKIQALEDQLSSCTTAVLIAELQKNNQTRTGKKEDLVSRVAEGRVLGSLPACPRCTHGQVHWSRLGGWFSCPGYFDKGDMLQKRCFWRSKELKRKAWKRT
ncbi:unnamed protein product [Symbiodinium sp. CCMP2456]|nr:unnamed protein product [Symbiodinium sp. CCMP2456]